MGRDDIDVNKVGNGKYGTTPLMFAAASGNSATLKLLLKHKDIIADHRDSHGCTALFAAAASGFVGNAQLLLERGDVDANARNNDGVTPLAIATRNGNIEVVKLLLERQDVDVNSTDKYDQTVLQHASVEAAKELIRSAIRERCETNGEQPKQEGSIPLNRSAYGLRVRTVHLSYLKVFPRSPSLSFHPVCAKGRATLNQTLPLTRILTNAIPCNP